METTSPDFIPASWDLPSAIKFRLGDQVRKPVLFWCDPGGQWQSTGHGSGLAALESLLAEYRDRIATLDDLVDAAQSPHDYFNLLREINPLLRSTRNQLAVMEAARKARPHERKLIILRDVAVENERGIDLIASDATAGMNFSLAVSGARQASEAQIGNLEARRLNHLVAFFFPLATLASLLGMNNPREIVQSPGFWNVLALGIALGLLLALANRKFMKSREHS